MYRPLALLPNPSYSCRVVVNPMTELDGLNQQRRTSALWRHFFVRNTLGAPFMGGPGGEPHGSPVSFVAGPSIHPVPPTRLTAGAEFKTANKETIMAAKSKATPVTNTPAIPKFTLCPRDRSGFSELSTDMAKAAIDCFSLTKNDNLAKIFALGNFEGEMAYALATKSLPDDPGYAVWRCQEFLLLTLGLIGDELPPEKMRQRGWIIGMFGALTDALDNYNAAINPGEAE